MICWMRSETRCQPAYNDRQGENNNYPRMNLLNSRLRAFHCSSGSRIFPCPHLLPQLMPIHECLEPFRLVRRQRPPFAILSRTCKRPDRLKVFFKVRVNHVEGRTVPFLLYAFIFPSLLLFERWKFGTSSEQSCSKNSLPLENLERQSGADLGTR